MTSFRLTPFPNHLQPVPDIAITGEITKNNTRLNCRFKVDGNIASLKWPPLLAMDGPEENLWKHTCFEVFIGELHRDPYLEFNFSPSTQWAVYVFESYREPIQTQPKTRPTISLPPSSDSSFSLAAEIPLDQWFTDKPLQIGIATVIETVEGNHYYYALTHCGQKPDFHLRDSFIIEI